MPNEAPTPDSDFKVLPKGEYEAVGTKYERKNKPEKGGDYHAYTFTILTGEFQNQKLFKNLYDRSPDAKERAKAGGSFAAMKLATGVPNPINGVDLLNKPIRISLDVLKPVWTAEDKAAGVPEPEAFNYVKNFKPRFKGGSPTGGGFSNPNAQATPPGSAGASTPSSNNPFNRPA
jgi:hypothetical protein